MSDFLNLDFAYAYGIPSARAGFRVFNEDFIVDEELGFTPTGSGEHVLLEVTKTGQNTAWVAKQLADFAEIKTRDVGYCGRKDRHAQCRQWFSLYLPGDNNPQWHNLKIPGVRIDSHTRHSHKLRPGQHRANRFKIQLRDIPANELDVLKPRLEKIRCGVPNYFGEQRFGIDGNNVREADRWANGELKIRDKKQRGLYISALRSYLFNSVLSRRVRLQNWTTSLPGDTDGSEPSGPLWGRGRSLVSADTAIIENNVLDPLADWCRALEHCGLKQERRSLICRPKGLDYAIAGNDLTIQFVLGPGQYATSVLREIALLRDEKGGQ